MEANYVILVDYSDGEIIKIKLSKQEVLDSEEYEDFGEFLGTLEEKYDFNLADCMWTIAESIKEREIGF